MTKKDIVRKIAGECGVEQRVALQAVQLVFDAITETLVGEGRVELRNFGVFEARRRRPRQARNPRTGGKVLVPERLAVVFQPGREMAERVARLGRASLTPGGGLPGDGD